MATKKQKAAARRNIKKAHAANRRRGKKGSRKTSKRCHTKGGAKALMGVKRHLRSALKTLNTKGAKTLL